MIKPPALKYEVKPVIDWQKVVLLLIRNLFDFDHDFLSLIQTCWLLILSTMTIL